MFKLIQYIRIRIIEFARSYKTRILHYLIVFARSLNKMLLDSNSRISNSHIYVAPNSIVDKQSKIANYVSIHDGVVIMNSSISEFTYVQSFSTILNTKIGKFCSIAGGVRIGLSEHPLAFISTSPVFYDSSQLLPKALTNATNDYGKFLETVVEADVWIGQSAIIKSGVRIGVGSVVGAGSVVTRDVPPYTISAGNPARPIRKRFEEELCLILEESHWWELDDSVLSKYASLFEKPKEFINRLRLDGHL